MFGRFGERREQQAVADWAKEAAKGENVHGRAQWASAETIRERGLHASSGVNLGQVGSSPIRLAGERHVITIAPSRSGKGTTAIVPTLLDYSGSVLVIDPKGQNAAVTARRRREMGHQVVVINPFGLHTGEPWNLPKHRFNPLAAIVPGDNFVADVSSLCEALIITEGKDPHFANAARELVSAIIMDLKLETPAKATLPRMRAVLTLEPDLFKVELTRMAKSNEAAVRQRAGRFLATGNEVQNVVSTAITQTSFLDDPAIIASLSGDDFRLADLKTKPLSVFLVLPSRYIAAYARWLRVFVVSAVDSMLSSPKGPRDPVLFVLDEFASLGHLSSIETAMGLAAGYGVRLWPILQDVNQAKDIYDQRWETFLANAGALHALTPNDLTTAEYLSKRCGTWTYKHQDISIKIEGGNSQHFARPLLLPQELMGLDPNTALLFLAGLSDPIWMDRPPYYEQSRFKGFADPDPFHS
jgi:type IV secretion system protein VirD4